MYRLSPTTIGVTSSPQWVPRGAGPGILLPCNLQLAYVAGIDLIERTKSGPALIFARDPPVTAADLCQRPVKDLRLAREAAEQAGRALPMLDAVHRRMSEIVEAGMGDRDWSAMAEFTISSSSAGWAAELVRRLAGPARQLVRERPCVRLTALDPASRPRAHT